MASITVTPAASSSGPSHSSHARFADNSVLSRSPSASTTSSDGREANSGQSLKSALARSVTGTMAFYFKRPIRLFRPTRVSAWTAFSEMATAKGHASGADTGFLRGIIRKQGMLFFCREALPPLLANSIVGFTLFSTYTLTESALRYFPSEPVNPLLIPAISGGLAGAAQAFISSPLDNVRALLATKPSSTKTVGREWKGWRHIAARALVPQWLVTTTSPRKNPIRFLANWWRSSWALFTFTLLRDSLGFAVFFSIFELSRSIAKKAGKAVDRYQADLQARSEELGIDIRELLEGDVLTRGWLGRAAQAFIIVSFGVLAGIGYGFVGRPFDRARTIVWNGLEEWAKERRKVTKEAEQAGKPETHDSVAAVPSANSKATQHAVPSSISHRTRHSRMSTHETRLPLHSPRPADPPKHPLKDPSIMHPSPYASSPAVPSALSMLRGSYRREGGLSILGFSKSQRSLITRTQSVFSRSQRAKSSAKDAKQASPIAPTTLESLSEHPALGGTSVFDGLPAPEQREVAGHRKARLWKRNAQARLGSSEAAAAKWSSRLSVAGLFRVVPPYCFGFLVYAMLAGDLSD